MKTSFEELKVKLTLPPALAFTDSEKRFRVEKDASLNAVAAVLAQSKEDGEFYTVQYALRTMSAAEQKYSVCEKEALAVIFA